MADGKVTIQVILDDKDVGKGTKKVEGALKGIGNTAKRGIATVGKLAGALGLVGLAYKGIDMVKNSLDGAIARYDTLNNFPRVMKVLGFDAEESEVAINKLSDGIQGLPTRLDEVASTAQNIAVMTGDLDGAVDTTLALNNAFLASGASVADASRGMEVYQNMLATGEVDGQRWKTLQETMGVALSMVAEKAGFEGPDALNKLYDSLKDGTITFDEFNDMLIEANNQQDGLADLARENTDGLATAWMNLQAWIIMGLTDVIEAIDKAMGGVGSISGLIERLKPIVLGVFGWMANTAIPAVATAIGFLVEAFNNAKEVIMEWLGDNEEGITSLWHTYEEYLTLIWGYVQEVFTFIKNIVEEILTPIVACVGDILSQVFSCFEENGEQIIEAVDRVFGFIKTIVELVMPSVGFIVRDVWGSIKNVIQGAVDIILGIVKTFSSLFTGDWSGLWEGIKQLLSGVVQALWGLINLWFVGKILKLGKTFITGFRNLFSNGFNAVKNLVSNILSSIRNTFSNIFNGLKGIVSKAFNGVRNAVSNGMNRAYNAVTKVFSKFKIGRASCRERVD